MEEIGIAIAFLTGLLSFFSPCTLPLVPAYLAYISGVKLSKVKSEQVKILLNSVFFVLGFSVIFITFGVFTSYLGSVVVPIRTWFPKIGGAVLIIFGLYMLHIVKIPFLDKQESIIPKFHKFSLFTSFLFGATFAIGWTPCLTPALSMIMVMATASASMSYGTFLLIIFSVGLGLPFIAVGLFTDYFLKLVNHEHKLMRYYYILAGLLLIGTGLYLIIKKNAFALI